MMIQCPMCNGYGSYIEPVLDYGDGPRYDCGYCKGKGRMKKGKLFYQCLGWLSAEKRAKRKNARRIIEMNQQSGKGGKE